ncbi:hypothetical protein GCM10027294_53460 [Marinactinospora endophytica]
MCPRKGGKSPRGFQLVHGLSEATRELQSPPHLYNIKVSGSIFGKRRPQSVSGQVSARVPVVLEGERDLIIVQNRNGATETVQGEKFV